VKPMSRHGKPGAAGSESRTPRVIDKQKDLETLCGELATRGAFALDTEFVRERTFRARLGLGLRAGEFVLLGSVAGRHVYPGGGGYCASKFAVRAIYETLRLEMFDKGVRCTTVDPGMVKTAFSDVRFKGDAERAAKVYAGVDYLLPEDIADIVRFVVTRPKRVNIGEVVVWSSDQASVLQVARRS